MYTLSAIVEVAIFNLYVLPCRWLIKNMSQKWIGLPFAVGLLVFGPLLAAAAIFSAWLFIPAVLLAIYFRAVVMMVDKCTTQTGSQWEIWLDKW